MKYLSKNGGETIIEVLIATVILVAVLASSFVALSRASRANTNVQNRIVAINLAREGIEAVRNIRDTNWLKYSGNRRDKWLCLDSVDSSGDVDEVVDGCYVGLLPIPNGYFQINYSQDLSRYFLSEIQNAETINISGKSASLESFRLYLNDARKFTHDNEEGGNTQTPFYRQIELVTTSESLCEGGCEESKIAVSSHVGWIEDGSPKNITLETHLFDFYQRNTYED